MKNIFWLVLVILYCSNLNAQNWSRFRGPNGQGHSAAQNIPTKFAENDYNWKVSIPGIGHSSPVIWKDKIFITSADKTKNLGYLVAVHSADGKLLWKSEFDLNVYEFHRDNSFASASPVVDSEHVYVIWYAQEIIILEAFDHAGKKIWQSKFPGIHARHGAGGSPILSGKNVIFTREQEEGSPFKSSWVAVDRSTGNISWEIERDTVENNSFSTPCHYNSNLLFTSQAHGFTLVDSGNGKIIWEFDNIFDARAVTSPIFSGEHVIASCKRKLVIIRLDDSLDNNHKNPIYVASKSLSPYVPTPIIQDNLLFIFTDNGNIACIGVDDGELNWKEKPAGSLYGSPVIVNGFLYCITKKGEVVVISVSNNYQLVSVNSLGDKSYATPAVSENCMYFRTFSYLISIGK